MRRGATLVVSWVVLSLALTACGGGDGNDGGGDGGGEKPLRIVVVPGSVDDFYYTVALGAQEEADRQGIDLEIQYPARQDVAEHTQVLRAVIATKPDAIIYPPTDAEAMKPVLQEAKDQGIKVVTFDADIGDPSLRLTFVAADAVEAGRKVAETLQDLTGGKGPLLYIQDITGQTFHDDLHAGFAEVMDGSPDVTVLPVQLSRFEPSRAESITRATITAHPDLVGKFAGILVDQEGVIPALTAAGKLGAIKTVGFDGTPKGLEYLADGKLDAIVSVAAKDYGVAAVQAIVDAINGKDVPSEILMGSCVFTADTIDAPENEACIYQPASTTG
jgi:ribose transport system substrate-binding protein